MGQPKALVRDPDGTSWLNRAVDAVAAGGCDPVVVVLGADADQAADILDERGSDAAPVRWVEATDWPDGMSASLRRGLEAALDTDASTAVVTPGRPPGRRPRRPPARRRRGRRRPQRARPRRIPRSPRPSRRPRPRALVRRRGGGGPATAARATTSPPTTSSWSSAATSPAASTGTHPPPSRVRRIGVMIGECSATWSPPPTWPSASAAPGTSSTTRWPPSATSRSRWAGRCSSRASRAPARPPWPRRSPRPWTCRSSGSSATRASTPARRSTTGTSRARSSTCERSRPRRRPAAPPQDVSELEKSLFDERFLLSRPVLRALREAPAVLLVDEIDRADDEFEAFLLEVLSTYQVTIPEVGTVRAAQPPIVVLTSNRTRELHDALKRRCLYHWIDHPGLERELAIVRSRAPARRPRPRRAGRPAHPAAAPARRPAQAARRRRDARLGPRAGGARRRRPRHRARPPPPWAWP